MSSPAPATEPTKPASSTPPGTAREPRAGGSGLLLRAGIVAGIVIAANALFFVLSHRYFAERAAKHGAQELIGLDGARFGFLLFSSIVGAGAVGAAAAPRQVGHAIAVLTGALSAVAALAVFSTGLSIVLGATLLLVGALFPLIAYLSWQGSRAAWAFVIALCSVLGLIMLFAAPKLGRMLGISMWQAMILPGMLAVGTTALLLVHDRYREA